MRSEPSLPPLRGCRHFAHWPAHLPRHLELPASSIVQLLEAAAARFPDKPFVVFGGSSLSFARFKADAERIAGFLQQVCGIQRGDRVLLCLPNSPQWMLAYHGIVRADAVVVPVNPMNVAADWQDTLRDSGATAAFMSPAQHAAVHSLARGDGPGPTLRHIVVSSGSEQEADEPAVVPGAGSEPAAAVRTTAWQEMLGRGLRPGPSTTGLDDPCVMPYTSGTTGRPRGCVHTHRSVMSTVIGGARWFDVTPDTVVLSVLPLFHVTGMTGGMNTPMAAGATVVLLPRWSSEAAAEAIERHRVSHWPAIATMVIDLLAHPRIGTIDLSSLRCIRGGGAPMPGPVAARWRELTGLDYVEGYGLSETMAATHINPPGRPKAQCLGIPVFDVDARVIDPGSLVELPTGETGEIVLHGPQVMTGYWQDPQATQQAFVTLEGRRFLRTGDLGHVDDDGYFFMTDRLKRLINTAGFKVSPAEVEGLLYQHPAVQEVCVIASPDPRRGEAVKALVVVRPMHRGHVAEADLLDWARGRLAAYKIPRQVEFVLKLPRSASGKVQWKMLQELEWLDRSTNQQQLGWR